MLIIQFVIVIIIINTLKNIIIAAPKVMSTMRPRRNDNYDQMQAGQTLFDFLKRKKKISLSNSVSKSSQKQNDSKIINMKQKAPNNLKQQISPHKKYQQTYRESLRQTNTVRSCINNDTYRSILQARTNINVNTTPRKVSFAQGEQRKKSQKRNSFIQMILLSTNRGQARGNKFQNKTSTTQGAKNIQSKRETQQFYRKNLNKSINILKNTLLKSLQTSKTIKQKFHVLVVQLKPLIKCFESMSSVNQRKRLQDLISNIRSLQILTIQFGTNNANEMLEQFHKSLSQHLISLQSNLRSSLQKQHNQYLTSFKQQKENKIIQLEQIQQNLQKQIQLLEKKLEKSYHQLQNFKQSTNKSNFRVEQSLKSKINQLKQQLDQNQLQFNNLVLQLDTSKQKQKQQQKIIKDLKFFNQQATKKFTQQNCKVKSTKQQFLLNQISILKKQFKNDMEQITILFSTKQSQHLQIIATLKNQIKQMDQQIKSRKQIIQNNQAEARQIHTQTQKYKKQNQSLVTDLHRMNEQLYQHWLALKDIKTLAIRLHIFTKFGKIYEDLAYNDHLFI